MSFAKLTEETKDMGDEEYCDFMFKRGQREMAFMKLVIYVGNSKADTHEIYTDKGLILFNSILF